MHKDFWLERWEKQEIGFHEQEVNSYLIRHWQSLQLAQGSEVLVPLCGKSIDMRWLREQGHPVLGVELSEIAAQDFFRENGYAATRSGAKKFKQYAADEMRILCGDFFDFERDELAGVKAVYDRASMVALPADMRVRYVQQMVKILAPATPILLVAFDYPQHEMPGPPFALSAAEINALYAAHADIDLLEKIDVLAQNPRFQKRGLTRLEESIYLLRLK